MTQAEVRVRPRWRYAWIWSLIWLVYLAQPLARSWHLADPVRRWLAIAAIGIFSALFIASFALRRWARRGEARIPSWLGVVFVATGVMLVVATTLLLGHETLSMFVYVAVMAIFLLPGRWGPIVVAALVAGTFLTERLIKGWSSGGSVQFQIFVGALAMWGVMQLILRNAELAAAREEITRLAVEEERSRLARDMHDILGHSLTVVAIKAELATRLVRLDPERAEAEMAEVQRLSREALADVRATVAGYREVTLVGELANARSALQAAGIQAELPGAADGVPAERRELFGWVIREGVTNVVRHSGARHCWVTCTPSTVEVSDDGRGPASVPTGGNGLDGLRERVENIGGSLSIGRSASEGFVLRVSV